MISELVESHGYEAETLNKLSDDDLAAEFEIANEIVKESDFVVDDNDFIFEDTTEEGVATNDQIIPPIPTDPAWNDYVMSQFVAEELQDGKPTVDGLRRLVELLIGNIEVSSTHINQSPSPENGWTATATHEIGVKTSDGFKSYSGSADSNPDNTDHPYSKYPTAIAETRAEARALRKLLRLRNASAEELSVVAGSTAAPSDTKQVAINDQQLNVIDILANSTRGKNIDVIALAKSLVPNYNSVRKLTHDNGISILTELNKYQRGEAGCESVPDSLLGYKADWRDK